MYNIVGQVSHEEFKQLVDKSNSVGQILLNHFLAFHIITQPVIIHERRDRDFTIWYSTYLAWATGIQSQLPPAFKHLNEWPLSVLQSALPRLIGNK
jgi:hypothetical protein